MENNVFINTSEKKIKTLANCTLKEFLQQANKIRHAVSDFYKDVGIGKIRKHLPEFNGDETPEQKKQMLKGQARKNTSEILDACLDKNVDKTIELVGLLCFKSADEAAQMDTSEFFDVVFEVISSERVIDFFTKLANSGLIDTAKL